MLAVKVVIYVSHVDDDILGAGGTISRMVEKGHDVSIVYATDGLLHSPKDVDNRPKAERSADILGVGSENVHFLGFPNQRFDESPLIDLNKRFESLNLRPDVIITNDNSDVNQDHRMVYESAMVVGRPIDKEIGVMTCEVQSSSEWGIPSFSPNFYVDISESIDTKIRAMKEIDTELEEWPHPRSERGMRVKALQRGMEVGYECAEVFNVKRWFNFNEALV